MSTPSATIAATMPSHESTTQTLALRMPTTPARHHICLGLPPLFKPHLPRTFPRVTHVSLQGLNQPLLFRLSFVLRATIHQAQRARATCQINSQVAGAAQAISGRKPRTAIFRRQTTSKLRRSNKLLIPLVEAVRPSHPFLPVHLNPFPTNTTFPQAPATWPPTTPPNPPVEPKT